MSSRSERPTKRLRRLSSEYDDGEGTDDWMQPLKPRPANRGGGKETTTTSSRPRRSVPRSSPKETAAESSAGADDAPVRPIRLTMKMPANKGATSGSKKNAPTSARDTFEPGEILTGPRGTRSKKPIIEESESEEEEEEEEEEDAESEAEESEGESPEVDAEADAEGEEIEDSPAPPPPSKAKPISKRSGGRPKLTVTPAKGKPGAARAKEIEVEDDDDEELSVLGSEDHRAEEKDEVDEEPENDEEGAEQVDEEEDDSDEDDATPGIGSRASTPDMSKLTKRQRSRWEMEMSGELLELPSEPKIKKILSAEEHAMRRAEMARRRKNLSEKRNEEEKMDTINKLLKKQAPKQRGGRRTEGTGDATPNNLEPDVERPKATMIRWISSQSGSRVGVPEEWLGTRAGKVFEPARRSEKIAEIQANG
ncbi:MAG: hypothetical protein M1816_006235 [Peltula sp. TS41687]|nr:MAG: hypothetical protein M1816_006235 [Peltula sp. TS41687]